ncbi:MAG: hypothetical protein IPI32_04630 [Austwickia sp.]|nr:hypothetical protein [Austwickia sp.]MBK8436916.1 hypothetical protein [Austwickia sp.]MBK9100543.1 hypothetical protein [Austwickia sp.]
MADPAWLRADPGLVGEALGKLQRAVRDWDSLCQDLAALLGPTPADGSPGPAGAIREALVLVRDALAETADVLHPFPADSAAGQRTRSACLAADADLAGRLAEAADLLPCHGLRAWLRDPSANADLETRALVARNDPDGLRELLGSVPGAAVADLIARYPGLGDSLCRSTASLPPAPPEVLGPAAGSPPPPNDPGRTSVHRVVAVRAYLDGLDPDVVLRWGVLWPRYVGAWDGAPLEVRYAANRQLLRHALSVLSDADRRHERVGATGPFERLLVDAARRVRSWRPGPGRAAGGSSADWTERRTVREDDRTRVRLIQALLHGQDDAGRAGRRQILLFDPTGRGRLAELRGRYDDRTRHVVILVPGTGTAMRGFHMPAQFAADLVAADPEGGAVALAWMGCALPSAAGAQAPLARFARAGAEPLRDVVEALAVPSGADITVIGHSYGGVLVGAAERVGLRADKVIHLASPGSGPGVRSVADYPDTDPLGRHRRVRRWSLTAPGDPIIWARRLDPAGWFQRLRRVRSRTSRAWAALDLGADPTTLAGIVLLPAGRWERDVPGYPEGTPVTGIPGHTGVTHPATTAFRNLVEVIREDRSGPLEPVD